MAVIQPVQTPDYGRLLLQGLQAFGTIQGVQARNQQMDIAAQREQRLGQAQELKNLALQQKLDPEQAQRLAMLDPQGALTIDKLKAAQAERAQREGTDFAFRIQNLPREQQILNLNSRIEMLSKAGRDPTESATVMELLADEDSESQALGQQYIDRAVALGQAKGFLETPKDTRTMIDRHLSNMGITRDSPEYIQKYMELATKPQTRIDMGGPSAFRKELDEAAAKQVVEVRDLAKIAEEQLQSLDVLDSLDVSTGRAEPVKQALAEWVTAFGIPAESLANVPAGQAFTAEANKLVLMGLSKLKGSISDRELDFVEFTAASLKNDPRANRFINNAARAGALRVIERRDFYNDYMLANPDGNHNQMFQAWNAHQRKLPVLSKKLKTKDGMPMFRHQFEDFYIRGRRVKAGDPSLVVSEDEVRNAWEEINR